MLWNAICLAHASMNEQPYLCFPFPLAPLSLLLLLVSSLRFPQHSQGISAPVRGSLLREEPAEWTRERKKGGGGENLTQ